MTILEKMKLSIFEYVDNIEEKELLLNMITDLIEESTVGGYLMSMGFNEDDKIGKYIRMVDVLNSKLKRKAITQEEFDKLYDEVLEKAKKSGIDEDEIIIIKKSGSSQMNQYMKGRPNKERSKMKPEDFGEKGSEYRHSKNVDSVTIEKINRHLKVCYTTDDYNEYKQHKLALSKIIGADPDATIMAGSRVSQKTGHVTVQAVKAKSNTTADKSDGLYHTTTVKNITHLIPKFRAKDGALYPRKRAYFYTTEPGSRLGGHTMGDEEHAYQYKGDKKAKPDAELNKYGVKDHGAFHIDTDDKLPVSKVKKENNKSDTK